MCESERMRQENVPRKKTDKSDGIFEEVSAKKIGTYGAEQKNIKEAKEESKQLFVSILVAECFCACAYRSLSGPAVHSVSIPSLRKQRRTLRANAK